MGINRRLYPRTIAIWRPNDTDEDQAGEVSISALRWPTDYTSQMTGLPASIQEDRQGQRNTVDLPSDAHYQAIWKVFIPAPSAGLGSIRSKDVVVDDLGIRYQVFADYWNRLGFRLGCIVLEV